MPQIRVNITTKVNSKAIRREKLNGRDHIVIPSYTLPSNVVMNGIMYPRSEVERTYMSLSDTFAPLGHPTANGEFISAFSPEGVNQSYIGAWNRNVKLTGNRVSVEKWIDVEFANQSEKGRELLERVEKIEAGEDVPPIHTSVAAFLEELPPPAGADYRAVAKIITFDHDAILLHEVGAATPEQGVGLMVNADEAVALSTNSGALVGDSYREKEQRLDRAAKAQFGGPNGYAWVADFTDEQAIVMAEGAEGPIMYGYTLENGKVVFELNGTPVARQESWVTMAVNKLKDFFHQPQARPATNKEGDMPLTAEEKAELVKDLGGAVKEIVANGIKEAVAPIQESITKLSANHDELAKQISAPALAEQAKMREVVEAKFGANVAKSATPEALADLYKQCGTASAIGKEGELAANAGKDNSGTPDLKDYKGV